MSEQHPPVILDGKRDVEAAVDSLLAERARQFRYLAQRLGPGWDNLQRATLLERFLLGNRSHLLRLLLQDPSGLSRDNPRLFALLRRFSTQLSIHETGPQSKRAPDSFLLADDQHYLHQLHWQSPRALLGRADATRVGALTRRFEDLWEESAPAASATTLGL